QQTSAAGSPTATPDAVMDTGTTGSITDGSARPNAGAGSMSGDSAPDNLRATLATTETGAGAIGGQPRVGKLGDGASAEHRESRSRWFTVLGLVAAGAWSVTSGFRLRRGRRRSC